MRDLRRAIEQHFDLDELHAVAFDLSIDWDDLSGQTKPIKVQSLIMHLARRGRLSELATVLTEERPLINLPQLPSSDQQIKDEKAVTPDPFLHYFEEMEALLKANNGYWEAIDRAKAVLLADELILKLRRKGSKSRIAAVIQYISARELSRILKPDFSHLDLSGLNMYGYNLSYANLFSTNLQGTELGKANLKYADLRNADLRWANLSGADIFGTVVLGAKYNLSTQWPNRHGFEGAILEE